METLITLNAALPEAASGQAPAWVQLTPAGSFRGADGRGPYSIDPAAVCAASRLPMPIDENHAIDLAQTSGAASPARGWITQLDARADGIWGQVEWTPAGQALVAERAYRGISPALSSDKDSGRVLRVLRAALTNLPNFAMTTLHSQETSGMELDPLRTALGLGADATFDQCVAAAAARHQAVSTHGEQLARLAAAAGAPAATEAAITTVLAAARPAASEASRMAQEIVSLNTQLGQLREAQARDRATAAIDAAIKAGKPITALREHYITRHMATPADVETELAAMISLHAGGLGGRSAPGNPGSGFTDEEVEVAGKMGLKPDQLKAAREQRESMRGKH